MTSKQLDGVQSISPPQILQVLGELCPTTAVARIHPGPPSYSNRLWRAETDEGDLLVRVPGRTTDPEVLRGAMIASRIASDAGIPTSRFRAFAPVTGLGLPVIVQEFCPGERASPDAASPGAIGLESLGATLGDWVGRIHAVRRDRCGAVAGPTDERPWGAIAIERVERMLAALPEAELPAAPGRIRAAFARFAEVTAGAASLTHGDLYLDNLLVRDGRLSCLLDFEHAAFQDRFADFGKLSELIFERHPATRQPFLRAYREHHPPAPDDEVRLELALGLYALTYLAYFHRWQPDLVGFYRDRLAGWLR